jgi:hypothetical protein
MRYTLLSLILLFSFSSCTDNSIQHEKQIEKITQEAKVKMEALHKEIQVKEQALQKAQLETKKLNDAFHAHKQAEAQKQVAAQNEIALQKKNDVVKTLSTKDEKLSKIGITVKDNKITFDANKTKDFLENFAKDIATKIEKVSQDFQQTSLTENDAGIHIDENNINIDLNKTKDFLQEWGEKMQGFIKEFDTIAQELNLESKEIDSIK